MNTPVQDVIEAFPRLTPDEQRVVASVILRSLAELDDPPLDDEALAQIADESFREY
jgi:hypothetical protein